MQTIKLISISKYTGADELLKNITLQINPGEKYGLIGANGCGKTTLLNIIAGCDQDYEGEVPGIDQVVIGYVKQHPVYPGDLTVREAMFIEYTGLIRALRDAEQQLADPGCRDMEQALQCYQQARDAYDQAGIDELISRTEGILDSLGLPGRLEQKVNTLSGGEKNILGLAGALIKQPDLLILDEPGNHLDFQGLAWFEEFLKNYKYTVLIVSHNRYLLDRVCSSIFEIEQHRATVYKGNYSAYRVEKLKKLVALQADYKANMKRIAQLEEMVRRFADYARRTADPAWGKRLHARKTQLKREKAQAVAKPEMNRKQIAISLQTEASKAAIALRLKGYTGTAGNTQLLNQAHLEIYCGEKVGLLGPNGSGKTTLIRDIVAQGSWEHPVIQVGPSLQIGYMAQYPEIFNPENTIEEEIRALGPLTRDDAFMLISRFLFTWQDMTKKTGLLSGGEINRLQLARLIYLKPNFLILDEPTNHLDIPSCEVVEDALIRFPGTLLVVSHDRYFLDKVVTRIVEIKAQHLVSHSGNFSAFWLQAAALKKLSGGRVATRGVERKQGRKPENTGSNPHAQEAVLLEKRITEAEKDKALLEQQIAAAFSKRAHQEGSRLAAKLEKLAVRIGRMYAEWEKICD